MGISKDPYETAMQTVSARIRVCKLYEYPKQLQTDKFANTRYLRCDEQAECAVLVLSTTVIKQTKKDYGIATASFESRVVWVRSSRGREDESQATRLS